MNKTKLSESGTSIDAGKIEQTFSHSKGATAHQRANIRMVQNVLLIWLDSSIDNNNEDYRNTISQLRCTVNTVHTFTDTDQCIDFLTDICDENVFMIISDTLCQKTVPLIHNIAQLDTISIFCKNQIKHKEWSKKWLKIKVVSTELSQICEALKQASQQYEQNAISISFVATSNDAVYQNLDRLDPMFMYTQIMKEILLTIKFEQQHFNEFIDYCHDIFGDNAKLQEKVDQFKRNYRDETPIWWYTYQCFLYSMLNRALRMSDVDIIIKMGFFITDLHRHIEQLHNQQFGSHQAEKSFKVYRGQSLSKFDFEQMKQTKGGLMSFNNFLSTSKVRDVSLIFAGSNQSDPESVGILFVITIDPSKSIAPFASIKHISGFQEEDEVLFSMHTVFRIHDITSMGDNQYLFQVDLILTGENDDKDLRKLTDHIRQETFPNDEGWYRLGLVLLKMGETDKAEQLYHGLLHQAPNDREKASIYGALGMVKWGQGKYEEAITFFDREPKIDEKTLPVNHTDLCYSYNNIGVVYENMGEYSEALSSYEKALQIRQQSLPPNHPDLGGFYNNIGVVYRNMGQYPKALSSFEKARQIQQQSLPPNHPHLGASYNNIGMVYQSMGQYSKALSSYEKALQIRQQSLPPNHPHLGASYNNVGSVYESMGEYSKALSSFEKALEIRQQLLPPNHPDLGASYNNIGSVYESMGEYSKALSSFEKARQIQQQSLPPNHPHLGDSYNNIGVVYKNMGEYSKALSSFEKALEIRQQSLPPNHPDVGASYSNIGILYENMSNYSEARSFYERAISIGQSLPTNHPHLRIYKNNLDRIRRHCNLN